MTRAIRPEQVWGIGLDAEAAAAISAALGSGYTLRNFAQGAVPSERELDRATPLVIFIVKDAWDAMPSQARKRIEEWEVPQRVLILDATQSLADFEDVLEDGFLSALTAPLTEKKIRDLIFRAKEVKSLYDDIFRMTREIMLERELLARKTDLVLFLNRILSRAAESLDPPVILDNAREDLALLLPIKGLMGILWQAGKNGSLEAELFLDPDMTHEAERYWTEELLRLGGKAAGQPMAGYQTMFLAGNAERETVDIPNVSEELIPLPLRAGGQVFGVLALYRSLGKPLGKDQVQTLFAAANHLALALKNATLFTLIKSRADHDGLTRIHNRRAFDERIVEEMRRHQRYRHPMSLLMLDIDHFKDVNDTYGHLAGDQVLREVGRILSETVRGTDFTARYGGEEFMVILPQTNEGQSQILAERLRTMIADARFTHNGHTFAITVSIGVAVLQPEALTKRRMLLEQVDQALYQAKKMGRNQVCNFLGPATIEHIHPVEGAVKVG